jgi:hypothetical protein
MLSYDRLAQHPQAFRAFTGLDHSEFATLLPAFARAWEDYIHHTHIAKKKRKRRYGAGRKSRLRSLEEKLLFILVYFKIYPLQEVMAQMFAMSQSRANEWIHKLTGILQCALGSSQYLPERHPQNLEQVLALCVSVDFIIDGTERRTQRPTDNDQQKAHYSGKKKPIRSRTT